MVDQSASPAPIQHVSKSVSLPKEWSDVADALVAVAAAVKASKVAGQSLAVAIPAIVASSFAPLAKALEGVHDLPVELSQDPSGAVKAMALAGADVWAALK